jgi:hypothetical protein
VSHLREKTMILSGTKKKKNKKANIEKNNRYKHFQMAMILRFIVSILQMTLKIYNRARKFKFQMMLKAECHRRTLMPILIINYSKMRRYF